MNQVKTALITTGIVLVTIYALKQVPGVDSFVNRVLTPNAA